MEASRLSDGDYTAVSEFENMQLRMQGKENLSPSPVYSHHMGTAIHLQYRRPPWSDLVAEVFFAEDST